MITEELPRPLSPECWAGAGYRVSEFNEAGTLCNSVTWTVDVDTQGRDTAAVTQATVALLSSC